MTNRHTVADFAQRQGVTTTTVWRWIRQGIEARNGERIRLPHLRIGARIYIDEFDIERFGRTVAAADAAFYDARPAGERRRISPRDRADADRKRAADAAAERLRKRGVKIETMTA